MSLVAGWARQGRGLFVYSWWVNRGGILSEGLNDTVTPIGCLIVQNTVEGIKELVQVTLGFLEVSLRLI